ncbi:MAG: hypothetical protein WDN25_25595 [Acetobacteraceae bacterium]
MWIGRTRRLITTALPLGVLLLLTLHAVVAPIVSYDSWWYHLPFASCLWNIGGGCAAFHMDARSLDRFQGFPKIWELAQGGIWALTGALWTIVLPQLVLAGAYGWTCWRGLRIPPLTLVMGVFASPMLVLHFMGTNNDLPGALAIAIGFFLLADLAAGTAGAAAWPRIAAVLAAFAIAGNIKYQALLGCVAVAAAIGVTCLVVRGIVPRRRLGILLVLAVATILASAWAIANVVRFGNPVYPIDVAVAGRHVFPGPEDLSTDPATPTYLLYGSRQVTLPEPVNFVLSITEFDWTMRGVAPWYSLGSEAGEQPRRGGPARTGGWGAVFVLGNLCLLLYQLLRPARTPDHRQRVMVGAAVLLCVATALLPRAHELRYWLYLPLVIVPINLRFLLHVDPQRRVVPLLLAAILLLGLSLTVLSPKSRILELGTLSQSAMRAQVPVEVRSALTASGVYCDAEDDGLFRWSAAVTGLPGVLSRNPADCPAR